jgi:hypothetical protein
MLYVVEGASGRDLGAAMSKMRSWLDHNRSQPSSSDMSRGTARCSAESSGEAEAAAFVGTFGGRLYRPEADASAA